MSHWSRAEKLLAAGVVLFMIIIVLLFFVQRGSAQTNDRVDELQEAVQDLQAFAESIVQPDEEDTAQQEQLAHVFQQIDEIHEVIVGAG